MLRKCLPDDHLAGRHALPLPARDAAHEIVSHDSICALVQRQQPDHVLQNRPSCSICRSLTRLACGLG